MVAVFLDRGMSMWMGKCPGPNRAEVHVRTTMVMVRVLQHIISQGQSRQILDSLSHLKASTLQNWKMPFLQIVALLYFTIISHKKDSNCARLICMADPRWIVVVTSLYHTGGSPGNYQSGNIPVKNHIHGGMHTGGLQLLRMKD